MTNNIFKLQIRDICFIGVMLGLSIVLSSLNLIKVIGNIGIDLSYVFLTVICYSYGGIMGAIFGMVDATICSLAFSAYGFSISWLVANFVIGMGVGLVIKHIKVKNNIIQHIINISSIVVFCAIGLLFFKTLIECKLYNIPLVVKLPKNATAFGLDVAMMIVGYFVLIPIYDKLNKKREVK